MAEAGYDFDGNLSAAIHASTDRRQQLEVEHNARQKKARLEAAEKIVAAQIIQQDEERELKSAWSRTDISILHEAQVAIKSIPLKTAQQLVSKRVRYDIDRDFLTGETRFGIKRSRRVAMWGSLKSDYFMKGEHTASGRDGSEYTHGGRRTIRYYGWGLTKEGIEYNIRGEENPTLKPADPLYNRRGDALTRQDLIAPSNIFMGRIAALTDSGESALREYAREQFQIAQAPYVTFVMKRLGLAEVDMGSEDSI